MVFVQPDKYAEVPLLHRVKLLYTMRDVGKKMDQSTVPHSMSAILDWLVSTRRSESVTVRHVRHRSFQIAPLPHNDRYCACYKVHLENRTRIFPVPQDLRDLRKT